MTIGREIRSLRKQKGITQKSLCNGFMHRVTLSKIENDKMIPSLSQIEYISKKLGVSTSYLINIDINKCNGISSPITNSNFSNEILFNEGRYYDLVKVAEENMLHNKDLNSNDEYYIGMSYFYLGIYFEAIKHMRKYINKYTTFAEEIQRENISYFYTSLNTLFKIMLKNNNYLKGEAYLKVAKKYISKFNLDDSYIGFTVHHNLAVVYLKQNKYKNVISLIEPFVNTHNSMIYIDVMASMCLALNIAYYNMERYDKSITYIKKAIYLYLYNDNPIQAGDCYINYTNSLRYSSDFKEAFTIIKNCLNDYKNYPNLYQRFMMQNLIVNFNVGNIIETKNIASKIFIKDLSTKSKYDYYFILGHVNYLSGDYKKAHDFLLKPIKFFEQQNYNLDLSVIYADLGTILKDDEYIKKSTEKNCHTCNRKNITL